MLTNMTIRTVKKTTNVLKNIKQALHFPYTLADLTKFTLSVIQHKTFCFQFQNLDKVKNVEP